MYNIFNNHFWLLGIDKKAKFLIIDKLSYFTENISSIHVLVPIYSFYY